MRVYIVLHIVLHIIYTTILGATFQKAFHGQSERSLSGFGQEIDSPVQSNADPNQAYISKGLSSKTISRSASKNESNKLQLTQNRRLSEDGARKINSLESNRRLHILPASDITANPRTTRPQSFGQQDSQNTHYQGEGISQITPRSVRNESNQLVARFVVTAFPLKARANNQVQDQEKSVIPTTLVATGATSSDQSGIHVRERQKPEAKFTKERPGETLGSWIDATKALATKSFRPTGAVQQTVVQPSQTGSEKVKQAMPNNVKMIQSDSNVWAGRNIKRSTELGERHQQLTSSSRSKSNQQSLSQILQIRRFANKDPTMVSSVSLHRRATPRKGTKAEGSPPKIRPADIPATSSGQRPPPPSVEQQIASSSQAVSQQKLQSMLPSMHRSVPTQKVRQHLGKADAPFTNPGIKDRSPSPPVLRQTMSSYNVLANLNLGHTSPPGLDTAQKDSPRPTYKFGAKAQQSKQLASPNFSSAISNKVKESKQSTSPPRTGIDRTLSSLASSSRPESGRLTTPNMDTRWPSPIKISSQGRSKTDFSGFPKSPFDQPVDPKRLPSSGRPKLDLSNLPKSPFDLPVSPKRSPSPGRLKLDLSSLPKSPFDQPASPKRSSSPGRPKTDLSDLPRSPFDQPVSPTRSSSPHSSDGDDFPSPKSAFAGAGWSLPSWLESTRSSSPEKPRSPTKEEAMAELRSQEPPPSRVGGGRPIKKFMRKPSTPSPKARLDPPRLNIQTMPSVSSSSSIATSPFGSPEYQSRPPFERPSLESHKGSSDSLARGGSASQLSSVVLPSANPIPKPP